jgi:hypothetical protein
MEETGHPMHPNYIQGKILTPTFTKDSNLLRQAFVLNRKRFNQPSRKALRTANKETSRVTRWNSINDVDSKGRTLLFHAVMNKDYYKIKYLLDQGLDIEKGQTLDKKIKEDDEDAFNLTSPLQEIVSQYSISPLNEAMSSLNVRDVRTVDVATLLIEKGADVNSVARLHIVEIDLRDHRPNRPEKIEKIEERTPLYYAMRFKTNIHPYIIEELLKRGADMNQKITSRIITRSHRYGNSTEYTETTPLLALLSHFGNGVKNQPNKKILNLILDYPIDKNQKYIEKVDEETETKTLEQIINNMSVEPEIKKMFLDKITSSAAEGHGGGRTRRRKLRKPYISLKKRKTIRK